MTKWVYRFGRGAAEGRRRHAQPARRQGRRSRRDEQSRPAGAARVHDHDRSLHPFLRQRPNLPARSGGARSPTRWPRIEEAIGAKFGDPERPLLVSVRSGARASMPGMMDTVLNLGLNDETVQGLARQSGDERFAYDSYRRFLQMYGQVVLGIEHHHFEELIENHKLETGAVLDTELGAEDWRQIVAGFKDVVETETGKPFPQDPQAQLWGAIGAVFGSWMNPRAVTYRRLHNIPADWGTAVNVQAMVFGNMGEDCATGVAFTRNPVDRRQRVLRRIPRQRAGRGRRRRHPHAAAPDDRRQAGQRLGTAGDGRGDARGLRRTARRCGTSSKTITATCRTSSSPSSAASSGCCRPAPASAPRRPR